MAQINLAGINAIDEMFSNLREVPWSVTSEALDAMAEEAEKQVKQSGETLGVRDPESNVHKIGRAHV